MSATAAVQGRGVRTRPPTLGDGAAVLQLRIAVIADSRPLYEEAGSIADPRWVGTPNRRPALRSQDPTGTSIQSGPISERVNSSPHGLKRTEP